MAQTFYPITPVEVTPDTAGEWTDVDVSAHIPANATGVILHCINPVDYGNYIGLRKNGSSDNFTDLMYGHYWALVGVDSSHIFEAYCYRVPPTTGGMSIYLVGYTSSGVTFLTDASSKTPSITGDWETLDCSSECPDAVAIIFEITKVASGTTYGSYLRKPSSTDDALLSTTQALHQWFIVGCDASQQVEGKIGSTDFNFHIIGYITEGAVMAANRSSDKSPGVEQAWTDIDLTADASGGSMAIFVMSCTGNARIGLRDDGSSEDIRRVCLQCLGVVGMSDYIMEGWVYGITSILLIGYAERGFPYSQGYIMG